MGKESFCIELENIGPHFATKLMASIPPTRIGIFAMNGEGKSFISRAFALASKPNNDSIVADILLSLGSDSGKFCVNVGSNGSLTNLLSMHLSRGKFPKISNSSQYIFHVFNSDYVRNNLERTAFSPSDDYGGYVVGRDNIDISAEEKLVEDLKQRGIELKKEIDSSIKNSTDALLKIGVRRNTVEFTHITYENVINRSQTQESETISDLQQKMNKLKQLPDNIPDIVLVESEVNLSFFNDIREVLETAYSIDVFTDDFLEMMREKRKFVELGMEQILISPDICPFCGQAIGENSKALFIQYQKYLSGEEARINKRIDSLISSCQTLQQTRINQLVQLMKAQNEFNSLKVFFPSFADKILTTPPNSQLFVSAIQSIIDKLNEKKHDISKSITGIQQVFNNFGSLSESYQKVIQTTRIEIEQLNNAKNNASSEQLLLRKRLCNATLNKLIVDNNTYIEKIVATRLELTSAKSALSEKKAKQQIAKSDLISKTFSELISYFFGGKYEIAFNEKAFSIVFKKHDLKDDAPHILSDGEKNIVAFCYYLASTHMLVEHDSDYNNIFFIIDDPISSMDYNYVYTMTQIIRSLQNIFPHIEHEKYLLLTHSVEFMGILSRNKILSAQYTLHNGKISPIKGQLILPYQAHLNDIYEIASGISSPTHTTGNSIRHILETLWRFERPDLASLRNYLDTLSTLKDNAFLLYTLSNELSHGVIRLELPFDDLTIQNACIAIVDYMEQHYPGQIALLTKS